MRRTLPNGRTFSSAYNRPLSICSFLQVFLLIFKLYSICTVKRAPQTDTNILRVHVQLVQTHKRHLMTVPSFHYWVKWSVTQHVLRTIGVSEHADAWSLTRVCYFSLSSEVCSLQNWNNYFELPASCIFWYVSRVSTVRSESRALRLRYVDLVVSIKVVVTHCLMR
jgi:hypothetical protein